VVMAPVSMTKKKNLAVCGKTRILNGIRNPHYAGSVSEAI